MKVRKREIGGNWMPACPKCKGTKVTKSKEWDIKPKKKKGPKLHVIMYACSCGHKFREAKKI
jgi:lysyl-tRNA synthetase class I